MVTCWYGMSDGLGEKLPEAYEWTFELLRNFTEVAIDQLKSTTSPAIQKSLDAVATTTLKGVKTLQGRLSAWEARYEGYEGLKHVLTGFVPIIHMILLGVALVMVMASALVAIVAWKRRKAALEAGKRSPAYVAIIAFGGAVLQLTHMAMALPLIARWLPLCVLAETYVCGPYREGVYTVLDDGATRVWPEDSRPDPFCRMVPGKLAKSCTVKGKTSIVELPSCPTKGAKKTLTIGDGDAEAELPYPMQRWNKLPMQRAKAAGKTNEKPKGDCFYPYKIVDTDLTAACPLFTDDLVASWMALVISTIFAPFTVFAVSFIGVIYMAVGEKAKEVLKKVARKKKRRIKRKKTKTKKKAKNGEIKEKTSETPSPAPILPESTATPSRSTSIIKIMTPLPEIQRVLFPVPVPVPVKATPKWLPRRSERGPPTITPLPGYPWLQPSLVPTPITTSPAFVPQPSPPGTSTADLNVPFSRPTAPPVHHCHVAPCCPAAPPIRHCHVPRCTYQKSPGVTSSPSHSGKAGRWSIGTETLLPRNTGSQGTGSTTTVTRFMACTMQRPV
ncbi:hypothetical protein HPB51_014729 [Rhipicephalus microplus]|uniref:Uncharacterized protein n=1 Tax=Rhipicephalus microplus TaxID=6941 RepID=A0A9J6DNJ2_RHIMP|nr:hypothetical protein HPB51_014729 [Rhipicephalus microplus]